MKRKKFISITVCLCLLLTMAPAAVFANEQAPTAEPQEQKTVVTNEAAAPSQEAQPVEKAADAEEKAPAAKEPAAEPQAPAEQEETAAPVDQEKTEQAEEPAAAVQPQKETAVPAAKTAGKTEKKSTAAPKKKAASKSVTTATKNAYGITVTGGTEGVDWEWDANCLTIKKGKVTVSGTATEIIYIFCDVAVAAITLDNLTSSDNGSANLYTNYTDAPSDGTTTVTLKGKNKLDEIRTLQNAVLKGTKGSQLDADSITGGGGDTTIQDAVNLL